MSWDCQFALTGCPHYGGCGRLDYGDPCCTPRSGWVDTIPRFKRPESLWRRAQGHTSRGASSRERERLGCSLRDSVPALLPEHPHWMFVCSHPCRIQGEDHTHGSTAIAGCYTKYSGILGRLESSRHQGGKYRCFHEL